jgi:hypothetical protein
VRRILRSRRPLAPRDQGTTLTELNVTMIVLSVVALATTSLIIGFERSNATNTSRQEQIDTARFSVETMSKSIRTAAKPAQISVACSPTMCPQDAFLLGTDFAVQFYANINNERGTVGPSRMTYTVAASGPTAGQLIETVQRPDSKDPGPTGFVYCPATSPSASVDCKGRYSTRVLAEGALTQPGAPIFAYYTKGSDAPLDPTAFGGSLDGAEMERVVAVEITLNVRAPNATRAAPTQYVQRVMLPNVQAMIQQEDEATP